MHSVFFALCEAMKRNDSENWKAAVQDNINVHLESGAWIPSYLPLEPNSREEPSFFAKSIMQMAL